MTAPAFEETDPTRASLIGRLKCWNYQTGWQEVFDTYWRLIYGATLRAGCLEMLQRGQSLLRQRTTAAGWGGCSREAPQ